MATGGSQPLKDKRELALVVVTHQVHRAELVAALGRPCAYCGEPMAAPTRDHIRLRSQGRTLEPANKVLVCDGCNQNKGS
ncbi:HNH endonuclease [Bradyrhizobium oligotrophicum]|uniref:HNH endonuclease n=1 Tax=Bradyrhizobium oligotrophicum TaxID=44255 RepID=UPI003EB7F128